MAERQHLRAGVDSDVLQHAVRADGHPVAQANHALEHAADVDRHVRAAGERAADVDAVRVGQRDPRVEQRVGLRALVAPLEVRELAHRVDAERLDDVAGARRLDRYASPSARAR